ncbi:hypothetical protein [Bacteroides sedimenti]|uniref:hypothetical protein n=1 Tax=Bacteroides sedimenti TaxID=2136147 RepID=UPI00334110C6
MTKQKDRFCFIRCRPLAVDMVLMSISSLRIITNHLVLKLYFGIIFSFLHPGVRCLYTRMEDTGTPGCKGCVDPGGGGNYSP